MSTENLIAATGILQDAQKELEQAHKDLINHNIDLHAHQISEILSLKGLAEMLFIPVLRSNRFLLTDYRNTKILYSLKLILVGMITIPTSLIVWLPLKMIFRISKIG